MPSEHVSAVPPLGSCRVSVARLLLAVDLQSLEAGGGEGAAALGGPGLGGQRGESARAGALQGAADGSSAPTEVEVFPAQAEEFAESAALDEFEQRVKAVTRATLRRVPGTTWGPRCDERKAA